jgi:hypothetical protein
VDGRGIVTGNAILPCGILSPIITKSIIQIRKKLFFDA